MLSAEQNDLITRTAPGTAAGNLMRRYWQPAALAEELSGPRPVKRVRLLGEDLVLFRDPSGRYGLLHRHCAHRGADLAFARCEDDGLRCPFHGWLYDASGGDKTHLETRAEVSAFSLETLRGDQPRLSRNSCRLCGTSERFCRPDLRPEFRVFRGILRQIHTIPFPR